MVVELAPSASGDYRLKLFHRPFIGGKSMVYLAEGAVLTDDEYTKEQLIVELNALRQENQELKTNKGMAMNESQQQMEQVIELLPDATLVINLQGQVVFWNKAMQDMTGVLKIR